MFRLIGCLCILIGAGGYGICLANDYEKHLKSLIAIEEMITIIIGYITYERDTLLIAMKKTSHRTEGISQNFLNAVVNRMDKNSGESLSEVWKDESSVWKEETENDDYEQLKELFVQSGYLERNMQIQTLEGYKRLLTEKIRMQKEKKEGKLRIYYAAGIMSGLFFCILLW